MTSSTEDVEQTDVRRRLRACHNAHLPFLRQLPAELRNRIYEIIIDGEEVVHTSFESTSIMSCQHTKILLSPFAILQTCQQLRHETIAMFYARKIFLIDLDHINYKWLASLSSEALATLATVVVKAWTWWHYTDHAPCVLHIKLNVQTGTAEVLQALGDQKCCQECFEKAKGSVGLISRVWTQTLADDKRGRIASAIDWCHLF